MFIKPIYKKKRVSRSLSPKDWVCNKVRLVHVTTHLYDCNRFFINNELARFVKVSMFNVAAIKGIDLIKVGCDYTHCHFVVRQSPGQDLRKMVNSLKGNVSCHVRKRYLWLNEFSHFWAKGFYVTFYSESNRDKVFKYINNQAREKYKVNVTPL